jgi:hypothetical protein
MGPVLEVLITRRSPTKWEWRVCDRQGATINEWVWNHATSGQVQGLSRAVPPFGFRLGSMIESRGRVARRQYRPSTFPVVSQFEI